MAVMRRRRAVMPLRQRNRAPHAGEQPGGNTRGQFTVMPQADNPLLSHRPRNPTRNGGMLPKLCGDE
jgi:hypothetical protein